MRHTAEGLPLPLGWVDDIPEVLLVDVHYGTRVSLLHAEVLLAAPDLVQGRVLIILKVSFNKFYDLFVVLELKSIVSALFPLYPVPIACYPHTLTHKF